MIATHAVTMNGEFSGEFRIHGDSAEEELRGMLSRMDGVEIFAVCLWALPQGKALDDVDPRGVEEYVQCAGVADRMTVEVRGLRDGHFDHWVIGRAGGEVADLSESISWDAGRFSTVVGRHEVFDASEAAGIFATTTAPPTCRRAMDCATLGWRIRHDAPAWLRDLGARHH